MKLKRGYDLNYQNGFCPYGYEYVNGYTNTSTGESVQAYCRKLKKYRFSDPYDREKKAEQRERAKSHDRAIDIYNEVHGKIYDPPGEEEL